jgi:hypothetical protein
MSVYFTSSVPHGNTEEISIARTAQYDTRVTEDETTEHVIYVPNLGEFTSASLEEIHQVFRQISGTIGLELWTQQRDTAIGNSGTH